jgi:nitrate/nitrite transport system permease protein
VSTADIATPDIATPAALSPPVATSVPVWRRRLVAGAAPVGWALVGGAFFVLLWQVASMRTADLPSPSETLSTLHRLLSDPFYDHGPNDKGIARQLLISLGRVGLGFGAAAVVGIPLGLAMGASRRMWLATNPIVQLLRPVSPLAWFPIWLAISKDAPHAAIIVIFVTALWPTVVNTAAGAAAVPLEQRNVARVFRFGRIAYLRHVLVPNTLPAVITGLRLSMGIAWMVIVAVEMLSGSTGIGYYVWDSYNAGSLAQVAAAIVLIGGIGMVLDWAFLRLARRVSEEVRAS